MASLLNMSGGSLLNKGLPYDAEIEYLESSGTQWIDLPFGFYPSDYVEASFVLDEKSSTDDFINAPIIWNTDSNRFGFGVVYDRYCCAFGNKQTAETVFNYNYDYRTIRKWIYYDRIVNIPSINKQISLNNIYFGSTSKNIRLFHGYNGTTIAKLSSYKHIKNSNVGVDLIPVRVGNIGYMYDKVSGQLFGNQGTGNFILGPDK